LPSRKIETISFVSAAAPHFSGAKVIVKIAFPKDSVMQLAFFQGLRVALAMSVLLGLGAGGAALGAAASASPWMSSFNSKVRLLSGTVDDQGSPALLGGVQLRMDPGWKTYWRNPGDSGVPPSFDWTGSKNLKRAEVLYPIPHRFADAGGTAVGYDNEVVFPVRLIPEKEGEPIELKLVFAYGLCKDLCIPNEQSLSLTIPADAGKGDSLLLGNSLARVPKQGGSGLLPQVSGMEANLDGATPELIIDAVFPPNAAATDLFIDGGDVYIPVPKPLGGPVDGKQRFAVTFASPEEAAAVKGKTLRLTLVSDRGSTDTMWTTDSRPAG
jgi:DsbC/DsbD-like thiol-disulfide interchange protein